MASTQKPVPEFKQDFYRASYYLMDQYPAKDGYFDGDPYTQQVEFEDGTSSHIVDDAINVIEVNGDSPDSEMALAFSIGYLLGVRAQMNGTIPEELMPTVRLITGTCVDS